MSSHGDADGKPYDGELIASFEGGVCASLKGLSLSAAATNIGADRMENQHV